MTRRGLAIAALVAGTFVLAVAVTFPTEPVVRHLLARVVPPGRPDITFARARLRPNGLYLDDVHVAGPDGSRLLDAEWLRLRPSLWGIVRGRLGSPFAVGARTCQGTIDVDIGVEGDATAIILELRDVELGACLPNFFRNVDAYGRVTASARVRWAERDPATGEGTLELRGAAWRPGGLLEDTAIRADMGSAQWRLAARRFELGRLEVSSDDFRAVVLGSVRLVEPRSDSALDVRATVTPGRTMPPLLRRLFDAVQGAPPDAAGARTFRAIGTIGSPRVLSIVASGDR